MDVIKSMWVKVGVFLAITIVLFDMVYSVQPAPFIDEIFHIPQAQKYCSGVFNEWDPKITTLPGLYISSALVIAPFTAFIGKNVCTTWTLRFMNTLFNSFSVFFIYRILKKLNLSSDTTNQTQKNVERTEQKLQFTAMVIGSFPLLYFFSFLYYTEPGSIFVLLAAYSMCLEKRHCIAAFLGFLSIVFRQNNVVWVVFMAGTVVADNLSTTVEIQKISASPHLKDKLARFLAQLCAALLRYLLVIENIQQLILLTWPYLSVISLFVIFLFMNDGVVVGDRSSHQVVFHLPQVLYFAGFTLFFAFPILFSLDKLRRFVHTLKKKVIYFGIFLFVCFYALREYTQVHEYLLADNRHYAFYVWRWILGRKFLRGLVIPFYIYAAWSMNDSLRMHSQCTFLWRAVYVVCLAVTLIPQKLFELRYFAIPYLLFRLHVKEQSLKILLLEFLFHVLINAGTVFVFLNKTFNWSDIKAPQRIIW